MIIKDHGEIIAIIIRHDYKKEGIEFFTPDNLPLQLAYMNHPTDYKIEPHIHKSIVVKQVLDTLEALFIKTGKVKVDLYTSKKKYIRSEILYPNDIILLVNGGHGFQMIEESEIIEVKQGPYSGKGTDKEVFNGIE